ncbi:MAG: glycoside hydrolase family 2 [Lentisphaerae bacterium]|nr:glycoside hydrolase family 2 [Lentisphaerota bacterium]
MNRGIAIGALLAAGLAAAVRADDEMAAGFAAPPDDTRPWCYWYWISDNLTKDGITRDLEAMARVGIGQALIGNVVDPDTPLGGVKLMSDAWFDCMAHAAVEARRVGVGLGSFNSPGWSQSGGPWVAPTQAMRYVAFSETRVRGPARFEARLPVPKEPFQDIAVLAFPAPRGEETAPRPSAVRCTPAAAGAAALADGDPGTACEFPEGANIAGKGVTIDLEYERPFDARSLTLHPGPGSFAVKCELSAAGADGAFRPVREFVMDRKALARPKYAVNVGFLLRGPAVVSFPAVTSRIFRLRATLQAVEGAKAAPGSTGTVFEPPALGEIALSAAARVDRAIEKQLGKMSSSTLPSWGAYLWPPSTEPESAGFAVAPPGIVSLGDRLAADGTLRWDVPAGDWIILRAGMTPTGAKNHPTTDEGCGLEVDKMNRDAIESHYRGFMAPFLARVPPAARSAVNRVVIDSYEVGSQNWTDGFHVSFEKAFGYDPRPWLPVLTGRIVGSADLSDRFLWDLRRHIADRIGTEYVGGLRDVARRDGLRLWLENYGHWGFPAEFLQYGGQSDDLGGEFWIREGPLAPREGLELRAASSAAHLYGKRSVYAEAFTSARSFLESPGNLKAVGDWAYCQGINHFVLHVYIHQPWEDRKPGVNAWFGTEFNRHNTWFEPSKAWVDYLRRCHFLLRRGASVADVAYFIGDDTPKMTGIRQPALPAGYDYDFINADALLTRATVRDGRLVIPDGPSYALLALPPQDTMRPETLRRIRDLVTEGASILGPPPVRSPSLKGHPGCDAEVAKLAAELWGAESPGPSAQGAKAAARPSSLAPRSFGRGRVYRGNDLAGALRELGAEPAVNAPAGILWTHRREGDADLFFVCNPTNAPVLADVSFRVAGRAPELWHPDTGAREAAAWYESAGGRTRVPLALDPNGSVFVVFRRPASGAPVARVLKDGRPLAPGAVACPVRVTRTDAGGVELAATESGRYTLVRADGRETVTDVALPPAVELSNPWKVRFPGLPTLGSPIEWPRLVSWTEHADDAVKSFSGTATYATRFDLSVDALKAGRRLTLDLGAVEAIARVRLNGRDLGVLWKTPFAVDITGAARAGANELEVEVTNLWWNRLVGDDRLSAGSKTTFTTAPPRTPRDRLLPSGLLGPVAVTFMEVRPCE